MVDARERLERAQDGQCPTPASSLAGVGVGVAASAGWRAAYSIASCSYSAAIWRWVMKEGSGNELGSQMVLVRLCFSSSVWIR